MEQLSIGDRVKISPSGTDCPWEGQFMGKIVSLDDDGTVAVEVESEEMLGHQCILASNIEPTKNGWWFMLEELEPIKSSN